MTETSLLIENVLLKEENRELRALLEACHLILARNFKELTEDRWRPHPWVLNLEKEPVL